MSTDFSASSSALGYIYQIRYALYLLLTKKEGSAITLESLDDVVIENNGEIEQLIQLKRHSKSEDILTDYSVDLWKTIRVWSENLLENDVSLDDVLLTLVTTSKVDDDAAIALLKPEARRNIKGIIDKLNLVADTSSNKTLLKAFSKYKSLSLKQKEQLVNSIQILDNSLDILDIPEIIKKRYLELSVLDNKYLDPLYRRVEGWWFEKAIEQLASAAKEPITRIELVTEIRERSREYGEDVLPIEYLFVEPPGTPDPDPLGDQRLFVRQLRAIALENVEIEKAIIDYYKAFVQRSNWVRDGLLKKGELELYEKHLIDEWQRVQAKHQRKIKNRNDEDELINCGQEIFDSLDSNASGTIPSIRTGVTAAYVRRGTLQILADKEPEPNVYWHPSFIERLRTLLTSSQ